METSSGVAPAEPRVATAEIPGGFQQDPIAYLSSVVSKPPSYQAMEQLAGSVAKWFNDKSPDRESSSAPVAAAYLLAAAVQLNNVASPGEAVRLEAARTKAQYEIVGVRTFDALRRCASIVRPFELLDSSHQTIHRTLHPRFRPSECALRCAKINKARFRVLVSYLYWGG
jgi:hypothetical protein